MTTRAEFFTEMFLRGTIGRVELRRMKWNPRKHERGAYDMLERSFTRDISEIEAFAANGGGDIFHGVNLRDDSGFARKENISEIVCAQADVDFKDIAKEQVDELLTALSLAPTFHISSGGGYQLYWLLDGPLPANKENIALIEGINKGLAQRLGGDYAHDVTRILRTPGRKNSKYTDGRMCEIFQVSGRRYSVEDLKQFAVAIENSSNEVELDIGDGKAELPERFKRLLEQHSAVKKTWHSERPELKDQSRSGYDMAMADLLVGLDFAADEIATILRQMPSGKGADASRAYLKKTIGKAWKHKAERQDAPDEEEEPKKALFEIMENITAEEVDWIWDKRIPRGKLCLFDGDPGIGKSYTSLKIAATLSTWEALPFDKAPETPLRSLIISAEDSPTDTLKPRLAKLGACMDMIAIPHRNLEQVSLNSDFLEKLLDQWPAAFMTIDPIIAFASGKNTDRASEVRSLIQPLTHIAEERNIAIVLIRHLNKNVGARALYRGQGSIDFPAVCRSVFTFAIDDTGRHLMAHTKNTITQKQKTLEYFIDESGGFTWGDECDETADDILGEQKKKPSKELEAAIAFLMELLGNHEWVSSEKVKTAAKLKGISNRTLWRAKSDLGVKAKKVQEHWYWTLAL